MVDVLFLTFLAELGFVGTNNTSRPQRHGLRWGRNDHKGLNGLSGPDGRAAAQSALAGPVVWSWEARVEILAEGSTSMLAHVDFTFSDQSHLRPYMGFSLGVTFSLGV